MLNLILFGPPGSGKGTQAAILKAKYQLAHLATGDLLREELANNTPLGLEARKYMDAGALVPDDVIIGIIDAKLDQLGDAVCGVIFDGFPRTVAQAEALDKMLTEKNTSISQMLALQVSEDELLKRILNRGLTSGRTDDANVGIIRNRVREYHEKTTQVANYYGQFNKVSNIPGEGSINDITNALCSAIDTL